MFAQADHQFVRLMSSPMGLANDDSLDGRDGMRRIIHQIAAHESSFHVAVVAGQKQRWINE